MIGFPRGAGLLYERYVAETGVDAHRARHDGAAAASRSGPLQPLVPVQGNLDPVRCWSAARRWTRRSRRSVAALGGGPFIFNLGHGVLPETPPEHVAASRRAAAPRMT